MDDERIIELFFARSEQAIGELDIKYGKLCHNLSHNILGNRSDAEECVNDAYLGAWNAIPPAKPNPLQAYICKIVRNISLKLYYRKEAAKRSSSYTVAMNRRSRSGSKRTRPYHRRFFRNSDRRNARYLHAALCLFRALCRNSKTGRSYRKQCCCPTESYP